jgi:hypothetical protein
MKHTDQPPKSRYAIVFDMSKNSTNGPRKRKHNKDTESETSNKARKLVEIQPKQAMQSSDFQNPSTTSFNFEDFQPDDCEFSHYFYTFDHRSHF